MVKYLTLVAALLLIGQTAVFGATLYDFESGTQGWVYQTYTDSQGITGVVQSTPPNPAKAGTYSLKGTAHLIGSDPGNNYTKGETYVELAGTMNLVGLPASVWVYAPTGLGGTTNLPNGWQMFFKDSSWRNWYGPWNDIGPTNENVWKQLSVTLGSTAAAWEDAGFDYTQIKRMGVKIGIGGGSTLTYDGPLYVDEYSVVPEPTSMLLLGSGLVGLFGFAVKRKKA